jgi:hypothetical protein
MKRRDIDRWITNRLRQLPAPKQFIIRRDQLDVEAFSPEEARDVSSFCKPGDVILAIMPDGSIGLRYEIEEEQPERGHAGVTGAVIRVVAEQVGKANEGAFAGYEALLETLYAELRRKDESIDRLYRQVEELRAHSVELKRLEHAQRIEETKVAHSHKLTDEYLGRAFQTVDRVVDGFLLRNSQRDQLKAIIEKLSPSTIKAIMGDLNEKDVELLLHLIGEAEGQGEEAAEGDEEKPGTHPKKLN